MRLFAVPALLILTASLPVPVLAQGQGGYAKGCPGGDTVRMTVEERAHARAAHQTNDTNGGRSSIDKSCKTWENGGTVDGPQPGQINWAPDVGRGLGGAHTNTRRSLD